MGDRRRRWKAAGAQVLIDDPERTARSNFERRRSDRHPLRVTVGGGGLKDGYDGDWGRRWQKESSRILLPEAESRIAAAIAEAGSGIESRRKVA